MINRIFFIVETASSSGGNLPSEENIYYSIPVDPQAKGSLARAYTQMGQNILPNRALTIEIREILRTDSILFITSFLFLPSYLRIKDCPIVNLIGDNPEWLLQSASSLRAYLMAQGIKDPQIHIITRDGAENTSAKSNIINYISTDYNKLFNLPEDLAEYYKDILQSDRYYDRNLFLYASSEQIIPETILSLQDIEKNFAEQCPRLYTLLLTNRRLERELGDLRRKNAGTETELNNQKQYVEVLRSDHATKELQQYYTREYEILPLWYKRFGHLLKVLTGRRTFKSLFRDNVKKYKN